MCFVLVNHLSVRYTNYIITATTLRINEQCERLKTNAYHFGHIQIGNSCITDCVKSTIEVIESKKVTCHIDTQ